MTVPGSNASDSAAVLASDIARQRECGLAEKSFLIVVVLDLDTVVAVIAHAARHAERLLAKRILIAKQREPPVWPPQDLHAEARPGVEPSIRLPPIREPRLNLQMLCRKNLNAHAVEEPRRVRRNIRRLIGPVVELVVTEQAHVRHEDACVHVDSMQRVEVVATVRLG